MNFLSKFLEISYLSKLELVFYPLSLLIRLPLLWMISLRNSLVLLNGQWSSYMGFDVANSVNSLFYRTQWINIERYGRNGSSPLIGLGSYSLKNWFHLSLLSSYFYSNAGAVTTLFGVLFWVFSNLIWLGTVELPWVLSVTFLLFLSSTSYAMAFARQNYQILGLMWLPIGYFGLSSNNWILASFSWFGAALAGITPVFFTVPFILLMAVQNENPIVILTILPALIPLSIRLVSLFFEGSLLQIVTDIGKMIGATSKRVKYKRDKNGFNLTTVYFLFLYFGCNLILWVYLDFICPFLILAAILFMINQFFIRVADEESLIVLNSTVWAVELMRHQYNWTLLLVFWLVVSPAGIFLSIQKYSKQNKYLRYKTFSPYNHFQLIKNMEFFFQSVDNCESVLFAFNDPNNRYANIFDGYRTLHELPLNFASMRGFHIFPDWWAVMETNYLGAPSCWGRSVDEVRINCQYWGNKFVVIYQESGSEIDKKWLLDFQLMAVIDWSDFNECLLNQSLWSSLVHVPKWFLLKYKD